MLDAFSELDLTQNTSGEHDYHVHPFFELMLTIRSYTDN